MPNDSQNVLVCRQSFLTHACASIRSHLGILSTLLCETVAYNRSPLPCHILSMMLLLLLLLLGILYALVSSHKAVMIIIITKYMLVRFGTWTGAYESSELLKQLCPMSGAILGYRMSEAKWHIAPPQSEALIFRSDCSLQTAGL